MRYALILAGGSGTRLWPLSREALPKQLVPLSGGRSLLELAYSRLEGLIPPERRFVCGSARHEAAALARIPGLGVPGASGVPRFIAEPEGRDTLAAIALSCALIAREDPEASVAIFTSDHVISPEAGLRDLVAAAFAYVEERPDALVTFGVKPDRASTGFGYLELGGALDPGGRGPGGSGPRKVEKFREKPDADTARLFFEAGPDRYLWNSGMFLWRPARFLELLGRFEPGTAEAVARIAAAGSGFASAMAEIYPSIRKISVDYGLMEPASRDPALLIAAFPLGLSWLDVGSWSAYASLAATDERGNAAAGETALVDCSGSFACSMEDGHLVACLGCEDLVVVHTRDATLVCPKSRADELKKIYSVASTLKDGRYR